MWVLLGGLVAALAVAAAGEWPAVYAWVHHHREDVTARLVVLATPPPDAQPAAQGPSRRKPRTGVTA